MPLHDAGHMSCQWYSEGQTHRRTTDSSTPTERPPPSNPHLSAPQSSCVCTPTILCAVTCVRVGVPGLLYGRIPEISATADKRSPGLWPGNVPRHLLPSLLCHASHALCVSVCSLGGGANVNTTDPPGATVFTCPNRGYLMHTCIPALCLPSLSNLRYSVHGPYVLLGEFFFAIDPTGLESPTYPHVSP